MKISTKGRYALRLMLDLAANSQHEYTPVKEISLRQDISDKYLEQIIGRLSKAGLVQSARGAQGDLGVDEVFGVDVAADLFGGGGGKPAPFQ